MVSERHWNERQWLNEKIKIEVYLWERLKLPILYGVRRGMGSDSATPAIFFFAWWSSLSDRIEYDDEI